MKTIPGLAMLALLALSTLNSPLTTAQAQGTAFTYQGRLNDGTAPANGSYDLRFLLYDNSIGGNQQGPILTNSATAVSNGLFTVTLDFGSVFPGAARWLDIAVRTNGNSAFTELNTRQSLTATPYAITAGNVTSGGLAAGTYGSAVTFSNAANSFSGNGAGLQNVNAITLGGLAPSSFWQLGGDTVSAGQFVGSVNNQPLDFRVNNLRVAEFAYASNSASGYSPNVIGGNGANSVSAGVVGATIGGGGMTPGFLTGPNAVSADFGTVVGGATCSASGKYAIAGGSISSASGQDSVALGGFSQASGDYSVAMGTSTASGTNSTAFGNSKATNSYALAAGYQTVAGGIGSTAVGYGSQAINSISTAMGNSRAYGYASTAMGNSIAIGDYSTAMGYSFATNTYATAMGYYSYANGVESTAIGQATANGDLSLAAGFGAVANYQGDFVWADSQPTYFNSTANDQFLIRAQGGVGINTAAPETALHIANPSGITIGQSATGGGYTALNIDVSAVSGGYAELQAISSAGTSYGNLILQNHAGNVGIGKNNPASKLDVNGVVSATSFNSTSDRNLKENFSAVSPQEVLDKVAALPITRWNFKQDKDVEHLGPMAQDFHAAFSLGTDDKHIATVDEEGVALAAIQGLNQKVEAGSQQSETRIQKLEAENADLKQRLEALEQILLKQKSN